MLWLKDGQPIDPKRVNIRNSDKDSILFIRSSQREDSGVYEITVKVDSLEDKSTITLQIVGETQISLFTLSQVWKVWKVGVGARWLITDPVTETRDSLCKKSNALVDIYHTSDDGTFGHHHVCC